MFDIVLIMLLTDYRALVRFFVRGSNCVRSVALAMASIRVPPGQRAVVVTASLCAKRARRAPVAKWTHTRRASDARLPRLERDGVAQAGRARIAPAAHLACCKANAWPGCLERVAVNVPRTCNFVMVFWRYIHMCIILPGAREHSTRIHITVDLSLSTHEQVQSSSRSYGGPRRSTSFHKADKRPPVSDL